MIKSSWPFQDACHIVAEPSTLQLPMWQEMHKGLLCHSRWVHPTTTIVAKNVQRVTEPLLANTVSFLGRPTCFAWLANYISLVSYLNKMWKCFEGINTNRISLPALVSHEILYTSIKSVHFTITNVARNAQGYSVSYQICSLYKYIVARNVQRVTEPLLAKTVSFLSWRTCVTWLATTLCWSASLAGQNTCLPQPKYLSSSAK